MYQPGMLGVKERRIDPTFHPFGLNHTVAIGIRACAAFFQQQRHGPRMGLCHFHIPRVVGLENID